jgi:hypothetical protein
MTSQGMLVQDFDANRHRFVGERDPLATWSLVCSLFGETSHGDACYLGNIRADLDADGAPMAWYGDYRGDHPESREHEGFRTLTTTFAPGFYAICLCHARNVPQDVRHPEPKLAKAYRKRHPKAPPLATYRVLRIEPVLRAAGGTGTGTGTSKRLHLVRGHFARYTAERPLLGHRPGPHTTGLIWRPPHVRGRAERGVAMKTYEVEPGAGP